MSDQAQAAIELLKSGSLAAIEYIKAHPGTTALHVSNAVGFFVPGLFVTPALGALGFGAGGPVAGGIAAGFQSAHGTPALFSALQSAAMGGWAVGIGNGIVQGGAVVASSLTGLWAWRT